MNPNIKTLAVLLLCLMMPLSQAFAINKTDKIITKHITELAAGRGDPKVLPKHESIRLLSPKQITKFYAGMKEAVVGWKTSEGHLWDDDMSGSMKLMIIIAQVAHHYSKAPKFIYSLKTSEETMGAIRNLQNIVARVPKKISSDPDVSARTKKLEALEEEWAPHLRSLRKIYLGAARSYWESPAFKKRSKAWKTRKIASMPKGGFTPKFGNKPLSKEDWKLYNDAHELYEYGVKNRDEHRQFFVSRRYIVEVLIGDPKVERKIDEPADFRGDYITKSEGTQLLNRVFMEGLKGWR